MLVRRLLVPCGSRAPSTATTFSSTSLLYQRHQQQAYSSKSTAVAFAERRVLTTGGPCTPYRSVGRSSLQMQGNFYRFGDDHLRLLQTRSRVTITEDYDRMLKKIKEVEDYLEQGKDESGRQLTQRDIADLQQERVKLLKEETMLIPEHISTITANDSIPSHFTVIKLLDEEGKFLGDLPREEAFAVARERNKDIVMMNPRSKLCRLGNYRMTIRTLLQKHEAAEERERQREKEMKFKEIRMKPKTEKNDLMLKMKRAQDFLDSGKRVKLSIVSRDTDAAKIMLNEQIEALKDENKNLVIDQHEQSGSNMISSIVRKKRN